MKGRLPRDEESDLRLRWTHRYEMAHLAELSGLAIVALYGDFFERPIADGGEQVWPPRRAHPFDLRRGLTRFDAV